MHSRDIAALLLRLGAVRISVHPPFTWTSGITSPIYCDNRIVLSHPEERDAIVDELTAKIHQLKRRPDVIAGTATAGIGWAALVADRLKLPMIYVRPKPKEHGAGKQVEGELPKGSHIVVIEDLISTGGSSLGTVVALRKEGGCTVSDIIAIFTYGFPQALKATSKEKVTLHALSNLEALLEVAKEQGKLKAEDIALASKFAKDPEGWLAGRSSGDGSGGWASKL